jgi:hypothetical protein
MLPLRSGHFQGPFYTSDGRQQILWTSVGIETLENFIDLMNTSYDKMLFKLSLSSSN